MVMESLEAEMINLIANLFRQFIKIITI